MKFLLHLFFLSQFLSLSGQDNSIIRNLLESDAQYNQSKEEQTIFSESKEFINELATTGYLINDTAVVAYLKSILDKVKPEELSGYENNVYLMRTPEVNAFCLGDGSIVVCLGLLMLMENEAQLAYILSHELAHFIERHSYKNELFIKRFNARKLDNKSVKTALSDLSISHEKIADSLGLVLYKKTNYDQFSAAKSLDLIPREDTTFNGSLFIRMLLPEKFRKKWPTHPKTDARVTYLSKNIEKSPPKGYLGTEIYKSRTSHLWAYNIKLTKGEMNTIDYIEFLDEIRISLGPTEYSSWLAYEIGAGYQELFCDPMGTGVLLVMEEKEKINGKGLYNTTFGRGLKTYEESKDFLESQALHYFSIIEASPEFSWRIDKNKGLICFQKKDYSCARNSLMKYVNSGNAIPDKRFINSIIKDIENLNQK